MRRIVSIAVAVVIAGGILSAPSTAVAAPPAAAGTQCSKTWHYITHGETGLNVRPDPLMHQGNTSLYADATPNTDFWNQQFLFCRDPGWAAGHYAVYSNLTGKYWTIDFSDNVYAGWPAIESPDQLFAVRRYDSTWWTIRYVGNPFFHDKYVAPLRTPGWGNPLVAKSSVLTGNHLFRIYPADLLA
jgi:hypothetical protein